MHDPMVLIWEIRGFPLTPTTWKRWRRPKFGFRPVLFECWHVEPGGRDSGTVCKRGWRRGLHLRHLSIRFIPWRNFRHRFVRCAVCDRRMNKAVRFGIGGWHSGKVAHDECSSLRHFESDKLLVDEVLHRLLLIAGLHSEDDLREAIVRPEEGRDQFLLWYRTWGRVEKYRSSEEHWRAPNEHMSAYATLLPPDTTEQP